MSDIELQKLKRRWQADPSEVQALEDYARGLRRSGLKPHYAMIACIESNLEALQAVLADIDQKGIRDILCLGGMVGTGPNPKEVIDLVRERCCICLYGWKDGIVLSGGWNSNLARVGDWIRDVLQPSFFSGSRTRARWDFFNNRPLQYEEDGALFVHGSTRGPDDHCLISDVVLGATPRYEEIFGAFGLLLFNAQTHQQCIINSNYDALTPKDIHNYYEIKADGPKLIINVGSVGQPRDRDPRAGYVERIGPHVFFHRVDYDFEKTIAKIDANKFLDGRYGERLRMGI